MAAGWTDGIMYDCCHVQCRLHRLKATNYGCPTFHNVLLLLTKIAVAEVVGMDVRKERKAGNNHFQFSSKLMLNTMACYETCLFEIVASHHH